MVDKYVNAFMCLDWSDVMLAGERPSYNTRNVDIMFLPCNIKLTLLSNSDDGIPDNCNYDRDNLTNYLGPMQMLIYKNEGSF